MNDKYIKVYRFFVLIIALFLKDILNWLAGENLSYMVIVPIGIIYVIIFLGPIDSYILMKLNEKQS
ncbi:hypothetical protein OKW22_001242 [Bacilli bacterium PM5-3]|nr:hypothetical protein [Bacilli bacterium PM5-3]MDH6603482.1 hypothetical protein [Bacilli bacterium PM5-9]